MSPEQLQQLQLAQGNALSVIYNKEAEGVRRQIGQMHSGAVKSTAAYSVLANRIYAENGDLAPMLDTHNANRAVMDMCRAGIDPAAALAALNAYHDAPTAEVNPIWLAIQAEAAHQPADVILQETLEALRLWIEAMQAGAATVMGGKALFHGVPIPAEPEPEP